MKKSITLAATLASFAIASGGTIDVSTGTAPWLVFVPGSGLVPVVSVPPNGAWAPAPAGSSWVSFGASESSSCVVGETPGNGCANLVRDPNGDVWVYSLTISGADLGATSGSVNFVFGSDNRTNLFVGANSIGQVWNGGNPSNGTAFNPLVCSALPTSTNAGNTQATYNNCPTTVPFGAGNLNADGSLTLTAYNFNDPIPNCPNCGNPSGFVLRGNILTAAASAPEPATFGVVGLAGLGGLLLYRRRYLRTAKH